jgi:hypothetical protein
VSADDDESAVDALHSVGRHTSIAKSQSVFQLTDLTRGKGIQKTGLVVFRG